MLPGSSNMEPESTSPSSADPARLLITFVRTPGIWERPAFQSPGHSLTPTQSPPEILGIMLTSLVISVSSWLRRY